MSTENDDLAALRETTTKMLLVVVWLHVPIAMLIGMMRDTSTSSILVVVSRSAAKSSFSVLMS